MNTHHSFFRHAATQRGQTLIEVLIATGLMVLVLTTLAAGVAIGVRNNRIAKEQAQAKDYARETLEWLRNMRDSAGWETFYSITKAGTYCLSSLPATYQLYANLSTSGNCSGTTITGTSYSRGLAIVKNGTSVTATVTVSFVEGQKTFSAQSSTILYRWN